MCQGCAYVIFDLYHLEMRLDPAHPPCATLHFTYIEHFPSKPQPHWHQIHPINQTDWSHQICFCALRSTVFERNKETTTTHTRTHAFMPYK